MNVREGGLHVLDYRNTLMGLYTDGGKEALDQGNGVHVYGL